MKSDKTVPQAHGRADDLTPATAADAWLFGEGTHARLFNWLGAHPALAGFRFAVWAPNARAVSVMGDWNHWDANADPSTHSGAHHGTWHGRIPAAKVGDLYEFSVTASEGHTTLKADPFATSAECPPLTASRIHVPAYAWGDAAWMGARAARNAQHEPVSIYELHLGSFRRRDGATLSYRELAPLVAEHALDMGFTHVELMPITEHPFYASWGYQTTGYFAPTARYGAPDDLMFFIDYLHRKGVAVLLDWVPGHFPTDEFGLQAFDGMHLFEHADPRQGFHPEWNSSIFNFDRGEVRSFLLSSATYWLETFHFNGLRVDGVASMLYLDYARKPGEWVANRHGGRENLGAVKFLQTLNQTLQRDQPGTLILAEESTAWPGVTAPVDGGGLGFGMKWNMGWMHDTLAYFAQDPVHRRCAQGALTFSMVYAASEAFVLPLSHDEVVHGKGSLVAKMPGDAWQQFANLRALYGYMWAHPGKKLLFMGNEFAQGPEWDHDTELHWEQLELAPHRGVRQLVRDLNNLYLRTPALYELDRDPAGFEWLASDDADASVIAFLRRPADGSHAVMVVCNFTPVPRHDYRIGVPAEGFWAEAMNTDAPEYGGSGMGNLGGLVTDNVPAHRHAQSLCLTLPPLATLLLLAPASRC